MSEETGLWIITDFASLFTASKIKIATVLKLLLNYGYKSTLHWNAVPWDETQIAKYDCLNADTM